MPAQNVDLVLAVDSSSSMLPCFQGLVDHLEQLVKPLQGWSFNLRLGVIAMSASEGGKGKTLYFPQTLAGGAAESLAAIYKPAQGAALFTQNPEQVIDLLRKTKPEGNEDLLMMLDIAADFPFGPLSTTRRVVAMFSDETIESGVAGNASLPLIPRLSQKYMARGIKLYAALPISVSAEELSAIDSCQIEAVPGGDGLEAVDFGKLLGAMAKSISVSSRQSTGEAPYERALFGQDKFEFVSGVCTKSDR